MSGEHGIPLLSSSSMNWMHFSTMLASHLASIGESRLIDFNHSLPMKEIVTQTPNPKWVDGDVAPCVSSASSESASTDPPPRVQVPKYYNAIHLETDPMVKSYSPGLDKLSGKKFVLYHLLNQQLISLFARLIDKSLHHLLHCPAGADPYATARNVYRNIRRHFQGQEWINKDILSHKWNSITVCLSPETTYNELLRVNAEFTSVGVGHSDEEMATKFAHLLQTHHPTAYIGLFTDLARAAETATIQMLWHSAQITSNALSRNAILNPVHHQIGQQARHQDLLLGTLPQVPTTPPPESHAAGVEVPIP
jgi:hypothetical protein